MLLVLPFLVSLVSAIVCLHYLLNTFAKLRFHDLVYWLTRSITVPLFKVVFTIRCVTRMLTFLALDTCSRNAVGRGVWGMMLTFLELAHMFDATQDCGLGCGE